MTTVRFPGLILFLLSSSASAATLNWPGSGGCAATLQACINSAASGDEIRIVTEAQINESITISNKSLTLAGPGAAALFAPDRRISLVATADGVQITLSNLRLPSGNVEISIGSGTGAHTQSVTLDGMSIDEPARFAAVQVSEPPGAASSYTVSVQRSLITLGSSSGFAAVAFEGTITSTSRPSINVLNNQILSQNNGVVGYLSARDGSVLINGNRIGRIRQGAPSDGNTGSGVFLETALGGPTPATVRVTRNVIYNLARGVSIRARGASVNASVRNNTISDTGIYGIILEKNALDTLSGRIANNLIDRHGGCGIFASTGIAATHDYNMYSRSTGSRYCGTTAGANDVIDNAGFAGQFDFRAPGPSAPQINSGSNADQPTVPIIVPVALPDIDGRAGRVGGTVDIGAHEFTFDRSFEHFSGSTNLSGNLTRIDNPPFLLLSSDRLTISHYGRDLDGFAPLPSGAANHTGVWYQSTANRWTVFNQDTAINMPLNRRFMAVLNIDSQISFVHTASAANIGGNVTTLDHPQLNNQPNALPVVTQIFDPAQTDVGIYNNSSIGVWYDTAVNRWTVFNQKPLASTAPPVPLGAAFNVLIPNPLFAAGTHAFRTAPLGVPVAVKNLDHPLLNNTPCAHVFVTSVYNPNNVYVPSNLVLSYNPASQNRGQWAIERGDGASIPAGAAFHVYVDPQQSRLCTFDPLFNDGFE